MWLQQAQANFCVESYPVGCWGTVNERTQHGRWKESLQQKDKQGKGKDRGCFRCGSADGLRTSVFLLVVPLLGHIGLLSNMTHLESSGLNTAPLGFKYECAKRQEVEIAKLKRSGHSNWQFHFYYILLVQNASESTSFNRVYQRMCGRLCTTVSFG